MVYAYRQGPVPIISNYDSAWIQDTMTTGQWTFNVGLRYDLQDGKNEAGTVDANIGFPEVMPPLVFPGNDADGVSWKSLSPRLGVTYALGEERKTLVRASLSQFPDALGLTDINSVNPVSGGWAFIVFLDEPGGFTGFYDDGEPWAVLGGWGFDPSDPTALESPNRIDPGMDSAITSEVIVGVEHSFRPELVAGLSLTWRLKEDFFDYRPLFTDLDTGATRTASATEYLEDPQPVSGTLPDGSPYSWPTYLGKPEPLLHRGGAPHQRRPIDRLLRHRPYPDQAVDQPVDGAWIRQLQLQGGVGRPGQLLPVQRPQPPHMESGRRGLCHAHE